MGFNPLTTLLNPFGGGGSDVYGSKPKVPGAIDYGDALKDILDLNKQILPSLTELGLMSTDSLNQLIERMNPGATKLRNTITQGYQDLAEGKLPQGVQDRIRENIAAANIGRGTSGSGFETHDLVRSMGLTSLDLSNQARTGGASWFGNLASRAYDPTKGMLNPEDAVRMTEFNWNRDWLAAQVKAAPSPSARGAFDTEMGLQGMVLGAYAGAAPMQRYQPSYASPGGAGGGEQGVLGGRSFFGQPAMNEGTTRVTFGNGASMGGNSFDFNQDYNALFGGQV